MLTWNCLVSFLFVSLAFFPCFHTARATMSDEELKKIEEKEKKDRQAAQQKAAAAMEAANQAAAIKAVRNLPALVILFANQDCVSLNVLYR